MLLNPTWLDFISKLCIWMFYFLCISWWNIRRWGDRTSYLKNVKCLAEPKNMATLALYWMGQPSFYHATVALSFQIEICNLDRTKSSVLATSLYKKMILTNNWDTRSYQLVVSYSDNRNILERVTLQQVWTIRSWQEITRAHWCFNSCS